MLSLYQASRSLLDLPQMDRSLSTTQLPTNGNTKLNLVAVPQGLPDPPVWMA